MKKQIKEIYSQCCTLESVDLENNIQVLHENMFSQRSDKHSNAKDVIFANKFCISHKTCPNKGGTQKDSDDIYVVFSK